MPTNSFKATRRIYNYAEIPSRVKPRVLGHPYLLSAFYTTTTILFVKNSYYNSGTIITQSCLLTNVTHSC